MISLQAEHDVHEVNLLSQCKSSNKGEVFTNAQATLRLNVINVEKLNAHDEYWQSEVSEATKNMQRLESRSWRQPGGRVIRTNTNNKATNFSQMQYARARANEQTDYWVLLAKAEAHVRRSLGTDHSSHVRERQQKRSAAQKARLLKAAANNKVITSSTLIEDGKGVVPQMAREMAQHGNQRTIDLSKKQKKNNLIAELKARGKDNYKKIRRGSSAGEPTTDVNELVLRNMLRDANDGNDIVVLKSTSKWPQPQFNNRAPNIKFPCH